MFGFDTEKALQLLVGIAGVYSIYSLNGILQEKVIKSKYINDLTGEHQNFDYPYAQLILVGLSSYVFGSIYNFFTYPKEEQNVIPWKNGIKCGLAVTSSTIAYSYAIYFTNFPVVMMIRSCGLLSVALVGVLFTGVQDTALKLGSRKIFVALLATIGMIVFKVFDPNVSNDYHKTQFLGVILMILSLIADGFLPDFQAVIKQKCKPHPTVLLVQVNKWTAILSIAFTIVFGHFWQMAQFIFYHKSLLIDLILIGLLSFSGQVFIYRLVKQFKQHIVPFIITTRKIFTVGLSIAYFDHKFTLLQVVGVLIVLVSSIYEFVTEIRTDSGPKKEVNSSVQAKKQEKQIKSD